MKTICTNLLILAILVAGQCSSPLLAAPAAKVRLQVAGAEVRGSAPAQADDQDTYVPVELLAAVSLAFEPGTSRSLLIVTEPRSGRRTELRLKERGEHRLLSLTEIARFLDAEVQRPARLTSGGKPAPPKPGDWVYLLARLRSVEVVDGTLRIDTSFPVPVRPVSREGAAVNQDTVECVGVTLSPGFVPAAVPRSERRIRAVQVAQEQLDVVRVKLDLNSPPISEQPGAELGATPERKPLSLSEVLRQVQAHYPKLSAADAERRSASAKLLEKQGVFDPILAGGRDYFRFPDSDKRGALKSFTASFAGVEFLTPYGIKVVTGARLNEGAVKSPLSPTGSDGEYFVGVKIPLLGGAGINEKAAALRQSRLGVPLSDIEFDRFRLDVLLKAATAYWDWTAAGHRLQVARDLLALARTRADAVAARAEAGDLPLIDVTEANQEVQRRREGLEKAERDLQKEGFKLSLYLWAPDGTPHPFPAARSVPTLAPPAGGLPEEAVVAGREAALQRRPELQALAISQQIVKVSLDLARNQRLPAVELSFAPGLDTGAGGAGGTLKAGVGVGLPLRQRSAEGRVEDARLKLEKLELDLQLERQRILTEVEDAVSATRQTYQRYLAASAELDLAKKLEQGERDRFALGDSTLFLVNQRERATAEAAVKVITIQAEYEQALAVFQAVTAQI